jgi:two-component system, LuxR family, sensor kinase FixL
MAEPFAFTPGVDPARVLAALIESSDDAIIAKDLNGIVLTWNRGAERMYGYGAAEMIGRSVAVLMPPEHPDELAVILARIRRGERVEPCETVRIRKDGSRVDISLQISPIANGRGEIVGASAIGRNISSTKRALQAQEASEARWRAIIDCAVDGIVLINAAGAIEAFNPAAQRMFGYAEHDVLGKNVNMLMPSPYHEEHDRYLAHYMETGEQKIIGIGREVTGLRRNGEVFPLHLSVGEMQIAGERHFTGILHDLTVRVRLEAQVREQAALARLGEMAAVIAHEVKNPLTAVRGAVQVIGSRLPPDSREAPVAREIVARLDGLNGLIEDLLLFARTPHPRLAPVDVSSLLQLVCDLLATDPSFSGVKVGISGAGRPVAADAELLKIVFQNLLINAAQAMQGQGTITAIITEEHDTTLVSIADQGPGIAAEVREKLFQPFQTTKARGTGLGLATARRLVDAHAGTIRVECPSAGGTIVTVQLPISVAAP